MVLTLPMLFYNNSPLYKSPLALLFSLEVSVLYMISFELGVMGCKR